MRRQLHHLAAQIQNFLFAHDGEIRGDGAVVGEVDVDIVETDFFHRAPALDGKVLAEMLPYPVQGQGVDVRFEDGLLLEGVDALDEVQEHLMGDILGVLHREVVIFAFDEMKDVGIKSFVEDLPRVFLSVAAARDELLFGKLHRVSGTQIT